MIGTQTQNNDYHLYLDPPEIPLLLNLKEIAGHFLGGQRSLIQLTLRSDDAFCRRAKSQIHMTFNKGGPFEFVISESVLDRIVDQGAAEPHLGWCHVRIQDSSRLDGLGQMVYEKLRDQITLVLSDKNH